MWARRRQSARKNILTTWMHQCHSSQFISCTVHLNLSESTEVKTPFSFSSSQDVKCIKLNEHSADQSRAIVCCLCCTHSEPNPHKCGIYPNVMLLVEKKPHFEAKQVTLETMSRPCTILRRWHNANFQWGIWIIWSLITEKCKLVRNNNENMCACKDKSEANTVCKITCNHETKGNIQPTGCCVCSNQTALLGICFNWIEM